MWIYRAIRSAVVDEDRLVSGHHIVGVEIVDGEVVGVELVFEGSGDAVDGGMLIVGGEELVAGGELVGALPFAVSVVPERTVFSGSQDLAVDPQLYSGVLVGPKLR